jgi:hypothetical protein
VRASPEVSPRSAFTKQPLIIKTVAIVGATEVAIDVDVRMNLKHLPTGGGVVLRKLFKTIRAIASPSQTSVFARVPLVCRSLSAGVLGGWPAAFSAIRTPQSRQRLRQTSARGSAVALNALPARKYRKRITQSKSWKTK